MGLRIKTHLISVSREERVGREKGRERERRREEKNPMTFKQGQIRPRPAGGLSQVHSSLHVPKVFSLGSTPRPMHDRKPMLLDEHPVARIIAMDRCLREHMLSLGLNAIHSQQASLSQNNRSIHTYVCNTTNASSRKESP
jgi:hypothetical protein